MAATLANQSGLDRPYVLRPFRTWRSSVLRTERAVHGSDRSGVSLPPTRRWHRLNDGRGLTHVGYHRRILRLAIAMLVLASAGSIITFGDELRVAGALPTAASVSALADRAVSMLTEVVTGLGTEVGRPIASVPAAQRGRTEHSGDARPTTGPSPVAASDERQLLIPTVASTPTVAPSPVPTAAPVRTVAAITPLTVTTATPSRTVRASSPEEHVVASGESLWTIANRYGVSVDALIRANRGRVTDPSLVSPGDRLLIPR